MNIWPYNYLRSQNKKYYEQKDYKNLWYNGYKVIQMDKKEYIVNQLKRTFHKKYENYCITRIIHKLDNEYIQFITQQLFKRPDEKFVENAVYEIKKYLRKGD